MKSALLGVNIDHVATLRQARFTTYPDPVEAALLAETAGADSITLHLREDRRHIQEEDVRVLRQVLHCDMNLEMAMTAAMIDFALEIKPAFCCIVPERREELTTEGGLDVTGNLDQVKSTCIRLQASGIRVSLFIDPQPDQINASANAEKRLHFAIHKDAYGFAYLECMEGKQSPEIHCDALYQGMITFAQEGHYAGFQTITQADLTEQKVFESLADEYAETAATIWPHFVSGS